VGVKISLLQNCSGKWNDDEKSQENKSAYCRTALGNGMMTKNVKKTNQLTAELLWEME
jgi:hypothetical protein